LQPQLPWRVKARRQHPARVPWHRRLGLRVGVACVVLAADLGSHFLISAASPEASAKDLERVLSEYEQTGVVRWYSEAEERAVIINSILFALVLAAFGALLVSRLATRRITKLAHQIASTDQTGHGQHPFQVGGHDELTLLAESLNERGDRIEALIQELRQQQKDQLLWTAQVAHDLRIPLTALQLSLQQCARDLRSDLPEGRRSAGQLLDSAQLELKRMQRLSEDLLEVARLAPGPELALEPVPLGQLLRNAVASHQLKAKELQVSMVLREQSPYPTIKAHGERLQRALDNLIGNALRFARFSVEIRWKECSDEIQLLVIDDGPGFLAQSPEGHPMSLPPDHTSTDSLHLGLQIAALVAKAHGGDLTAVRTPDGKTRVGLRIAKSPSNT